jgi:hypothetical protein
LPRVSVGRCGFSFANCASLRNSRDSSMTSIWRP